MFPIIPCIAVIFNILFIILIVRAIFKKKSNTELFNKTENYDNEPIAKELSIEDISSAKEEEKSVEKTEQEKIREYINLYLVPNSRWYYKNYKEMFDPVCHQCPDSKAIRKYIVKDLTYKKFLQTLYWQAIRWHKKVEMGFKCESCGSKNNLHIHHKTYKHHGFEHIYWKEDLVVLCEECHEKAHNLDKKIVPESYIDEQVQQF